MYIYHYEKKDNNTWCEWWFRLSILQFITKTRGLSHNIKLEIEDFENLLFKDSEIIKKQNK